jgi:hypothetical protein
MQILSVQAFRFAIAALLIGATTSSAHAYLDPGTGSMALQVLLGGIAGLALVGKFYWHKLLMLVGLRKRDKDAAIAEADRHGRR